MDKTNLTDRSEVSVNNLKRKSLFVYSHTVFTIHVEYQD